MAKMTDGEVMVYLRNAALAISKIAQERGIEVKIRCDSDGFISTEADDYEYVQINTDTEGDYKFRRLGDVYNWEDHVPTKNIRFGQAPAEEDEHGE